MKHAFRLSRARALVVALAAVFGAAAAPARAQTLSATPDTAIFQITHTTIPGTPTPTPTATPATTPTPGPTPAPLARDSFAGDISGNGRFVVIESTGDIATNRSAARNNADGNHEIFLFDYAQRRIFQLTNTTSALKDATKTAVDPTNIDVPVVNLQPSLSRDGKWVVFASNAYSDADLSASPKNFVGASHVAALKADGNTEIFIYRIPDVADIDLSQGTEVASIDLTANTPQRVTFTDETARPAAPPLPASFALDNYAPSVNDDGSLVAFTSMARTGTTFTGIVGANNPDGNKELFLYRNSGAGAGTFLQLTTTADVPPSTASPLGRLVFNENPSISSCPPAATTGCRIAFVSNADNIITEGSAESDANEGNGEIFVVEYSPAAGTKGALRQVTRTPRDPNLGREGVSVNILSPGRRISRDGTRVAFESTANAFNSDGTINGSIAATTGIFIANVTGAAPSPAQVSVRAPAGQFDVELHFPTFTGDSTRVLWASNLNLKADGTVETTAGQGLNQSNRVQVFSAPVDALTTVARVTNLATGSFNAVQPFPADTVRRMALTLRNEQGGGNADGLAEAHYQFIP
ncbi:MAG: TolB family protein, partial [Pyrinomonadaceae bacterium]